MKFATKLIISLFAIASAAVTSIVGTVEWIDTRNAKAIHASQTEIMNTMIDWRSERKAEIKAGDDILAMEIRGIKDQISSIDKNVRLIIKMKLDDKRLQAQKDEDDESYAIIQGKQEKNI